MRRITKSIGKAHSNPQDPATIADIKRVLICRPNHRLGNLLLITPLLEEISRTFPHCKIDLFVRGTLAPALFKNYDQVADIIQLPARPFKHLLNYIWGWLSLRKHSYDIVINTSKDSSSGRLSTQFVHSRYKFFGGIDPQLQLDHPDHVHMAKYPVYSFRTALRQWGIPDSNKEIPPLNLRLSFSEIAGGRETLQKLVHNQKKTICLFTAATGSKSYPESWWELIYERLQKEYPDHNIIEVLPVNNVSKLAFRTPVFYSKDIRGIGALIANTQLFVSADCGIMHLASAAQIPVIGLFCVTDANKYQPYSNNSVGLNTNNCDVDDCFRVIDQILHSGFSPQMEQQTVPVAL